MTISRLSLALTFAACGGGNGMTGDDDATPGDAPVDTAPAGPCWPIDSVTPGGTITLGTGDPFIVMPDNVPTHFGPQFGYDIPVRSRITGLAPGNPGNILDPANPRTMFRGYFVDTGEPLNTVACPNRFAYEQSGSGMDLEVVAAILFEVGLPESEIFGRQVRVVVEIIDSNGLYATDEKIVTCEPPPS